MSTEEDQIPALWRRLIDDAAVFPPGNAPIDEAVRAHIKHRSAWYAECVGPLLLPVSGVDAAVELLQSTGQVVPEIALAVRPGAADLDEIGEAVRVLSKVPGTTVTGVEMALPKDEPQGQAAADLVKRLGETVGDGVPLWIEVRSGDDAEQAMRAIKASTFDAGAKFRTGGTDAISFPTVNTLLSILTGVAETGVTLKLTAGLHHLHRYDDQELGTTHHGFGNVLLALHTLLEPGDTSEDARSVLASTDTSATAAELDELSPEHVKRLRAHFHSFGCCGVTDPVADLVDADLLDLPEEDE